MKQKITKEINLMELLEKYPQTAEILMAKGFHCLGCTLASFETLAQGAEAHGMDDKAIDSLVEELNKAIAK